MVLNLDGHQNAGNGVLKSELINRLWTDIGSNLTAKMYK